MSSEVVLEGTLGVDARRAAAKIRDHLLANPATWLSELGRVAVLSGASQLAVDLRATRIVVEWNGDAIASEVVERFGRHLLGDDEEQIVSQRARRARPDRRPELLTLAVFAALGDTARAVEIRLAVGPHQAKARRLTREELEGALSTDNATTRELPRSSAFGLLPDACAAIVIDLGASIGALAQWVGLVQAPAAVRELGARLGSGLAITVDGEPLASPSERAVLSLELPAVGDLTIRLDLMATPQAEPRTVYYELGFEIARSPLLGLSRELPIRVVVSGSRVPTNASRSLVDETVAESVRRQVLEGLPLACEGLRAAIVGALARDDEEARRALEQAAGYLAVVALRENPVDPFFKAFAPVLSWPLLRDAVGRPLGVRDAQRRAGGYEIYARVQSEPLSADHAPLVSDVIWRRGTSAERAFKLLDYDVIAEDVERGVRRGRQLAAARVPFEPPPCATALWSYAGKRHDGFEWKLALDTESTGPCLLRIFVGDDLIETIEVEHSSPFYRYDAAVRWPDVVVAERTMAKMRAGEGANRMRAELQTVLEQSLLRALQAGDAQRAGPARRLALRLLAAALKPLPVMMNMPLWERAGGGYASTRELTESITQRGHLFVMLRRLVEGETAPNEPVVVVTDDERPLFCNAVGHGALRDYTPYAGSPAATLATLACFSDAKLAPHSFKWREYLLAVAPAASGRHVALHRGLLVVDKELHNGRGMLVVTDGETTLTHTATDHEAMLKQAWQSFIAWLSESASRMAASITAPEVRSALLRKLAADISRKALPALPFADWPVFRLHTAATGERDASATEILAHFADIEGIPTMARGHVYDSNVDRVVAGDRDRTLLERVARRPCVAAARSKPKELWRDKDDLDDLLAPLRQIRPSAQDSPPVPVASRPPPVDPPRAAPGPAAAARLPVAAPPVEASQAQRQGRRADGSWPAPTVVPVDPDDILGPIRYLMTEPKARHAGSAKQQAERAPAPLPLVSPLLEVSTAPQAGVAEPTLPPPGAWDRLVSLFKKPLAEVPRDHPLATMAKRVTENLYVAGLELRLGDGSDAPVRFERATTTLVLNPEHATVRVLLENGDVIPLVAAAFSEINRELKTVSDAEERRALGRMLLGLIVEPPSRPRAS